MIPTRYVFEVVRVNSRGRVEKKGAGEAQGRIEELGDGVTIELAMIPGGKFLMGGPMKGDEVQQSLKNEFPQHEVVTSTFLMGRFEVTQAQWRFVAEKLSRVSLDLIADPSHFKGEDLPVENVSWEEAIEFCERLTRKTGRKYRLPSEAEWEYACRAGTVTPFAFGETITTDLANFNGQYPYHPRVKGIYRTKTTQVGSFESANAFGLFDMHGNVWEWCQDVWHENYDGAPNDGSAWLSGGESEMRVARGGSWYYRATFCRSAFRYRFPSPSHKHNNIGFRVVMSVR
jgi:formylglycine-generating enzyme required for sulfatase activity